MKTSIFSLFLVSILLYCSMGKTGILISFQINKAYIAEVFCVNKAKPQLHCDGKCFLKQKLQEQDQQEDNTLHVVSLPEIFWLPLYAVIQNNSLLHSIAIKFSNSRDLLISKIGYSLFHPPCFKETFYC